MNRISSFSMSPLSAIPKEICIDIFCYLDEVSVAKASRVSKVWNATLFERPKLTGAEYANLTKESVRKYQHLTYLEIGENKEFDDASIQGLPLTMLFIAPGNDGITNAGIQGMALRCLELRANLSITDVGIQHLNLHQLNLQENDRITNEGICRMKLTHLDLNNNRQITDLGSSKDTLICLDLTRTAQICNEQLAQTRLKYLSLCGNEKISNAGIMYMDSLESLDLTSNTMITDEAIIGKKLKDFNLSSNNLITDSALKKLPLEFLDVQLNPLITDRGIENLLLKEFWYCESTPFQITSEGIAKLPLDCLVNNQKNPFASIL